MSWICWSYTIVQKREKTCETKRLASKHVKQNDWPVSIIEILSKNNEWNMLKMSSFFEDIFSKQPGWFQKQL